MLLKYAVRQRKFNSNGLRKIGGGGKKRVLWGILNDFKNLNAIERLHDGHIGVPKQWNCGHVGVSIQSCGS